MKKLMTWGAGLTLGAITMLWLFCGMVAIVLAVSLAAGVSMLTRAFAAGSRV